MTSIADGKVPIDNGAFRYGFGLFETMLVKNGSIELGDYHMERLFNGMKQLMLDIPTLMTPAMLEKNVANTVKKNGLEALCRVRLQIYAGGGGMFGPAAAQPGYIIECFPLEADAIEYNTNGLVIGIAGGLRKSPDSLSNLKSCNALIYAMAARQSKAQKWNDALVLNTTGNIIESTIANLFWVKDKIIHTPPLSEGCIAGVMRRHIITTIPGIVEQPLTTEALMEADEVFLTNSIKKIKWVGSIGDKRYSNKISASLL